jgi:large subunit ribosomal protein L24
LLKRGGEVVIIAGDDRGKVGKIMEVLHERNMVIVEGVAVAKKCVRKSQEFPNGAILEKPMPIHMSNVALRIAATKRGEGKRRKNKSA